MAELWRTQMNKIFSAALLLSTVCAGPILAQTTTPPSPATPPTSTMAPAATTGMKGFVQDIEDLAVKNNEFRRVLYTAKHSQLVVMALKPKEEIGEEVHKLDQFFRVEEGTGEAVLNGVRTARAYPVDADTHQG